MVATTDVGRVAAELLQETWTGRRIIELEGPTRVTPNQIAATFAEIFSHPVQARGCSPPNVGTAFQVSGHEASGAAHPDARRLQPRMDRIRAGRNAATKRADRIERGFDGLGGQELNRGLHGPNRLLPIKRTAVTAFVPITTVHSKLRCNRSRPVSVANIVDVKTAYFARKPSTSLAVTKGLRGHPPFPGPENLPGGTEAICRDKLRRARATLIWRPDGFTPEMVGGPP